MASKQFLGTVKNFRVTGDDAPEIIVTLSIPLDDRTVKDLSFLGAVKRHGQVVIDIMSAQGEMDIGASQPAERVPAVPAEVS
jgi:hypothetical protein